MSDLTPQQQLNLGLSSHNNNYLFSNHYLDNILKADNWGKTWAEAKQHGRDLLTFLQPLYQQEKANLANYSESQLEEHWFKPILTYLGHTYEGQAKIPALGRGVKYPDYVFFPDDATRQTAVSAQQTDAYTNDALALGEVKKWGISLDRKLTSGQVNFNDNNPMYQIDYYLRATGLTWGILSNGRVWRLLHKDSSYKLDVYFELDLEQALLQADTTSGQAIAAFFVLFFQQASFRPDAQGRTFLQEALTASTRYAQELEEDLRDNAYRALEHLIQGFIDPSRNNLTAVDLPQIYTSSLYLLYRIIFLFYGERRGLLPMHNLDYAERSLTQLAQDIADQLDKGTVFPPTSKLLWCRLEELFTIINGNDPDLNQYLGVPRYNGGLFNPDLHPFLVDYYVGDGHLAQAINVLARREVADSKTTYHWENVDYRTLGVRQIGSIYEGLLEYKPRRATRDLVAIKKGKSETWIPVAEKPKKVSLSSSPTRQEGDIYLETDKGERKATGSYYTPDYIVKYIVEQTLTPLVAQAQAHAEAQGVPLEAELLQLNVLDPAMGSGHFLVEATNFLARKLIEAGSENEADPSRETELIYWKRRVVEACIYGVDKNPMAVELAKLSLWLETVAAEKPLSFLDHHLRHGDSLVGARLADLRRAPGAREEAQAEGQKPLLDESAFTTAVNLAVGGMTRIETMLSETLEDVHTKEGIFHELQGHLTKWQQLADLWVSYYFGNSFTPQEYRALSAYVQGQTSSMSEKEAAHWLAHTAVTDNDYFHWELAFPEVFFDEHGRGLGDSAGFDAVVGNPPYVRQEQLMATKAFWQMQYAVYHNAADLYIYFLELATRLLRQVGQAGVIVSHKFMRAEYGLPTRRWLTRQAAIEHLVHFGDLPVFEGADAYPVIVQWCKKRLAAPEVHQVRVAQFTEMGFEGNLPAAVSKITYTVSTIGLQDSGWTLRNGQITKLQSKIKAASVTLGEYVHGKIHYGLKTGYNEAFFISSAQAQQIVQTTPSAGSFIKPLLTGEDLGHYALYPRAQFLIVIPAGWTTDTSGLTDEEKAWAWLKQTYPALAQQLAPFAAKARQRQDMGDFWWELRPCAYYEAFEQPKIIYPVIAKGLRFTLDKEGFYSNDKTFILPVEDNYLLALLNAQLTGFFAQFALSGLKGDYLEFRTAHFQHAPVFKVTFETPEADRTAALQTALTHYNAGHDTAVIEWAETELAIPRNDTLHDLLAHLAQTMLDLNQQKQAKLSDFWLDLEGLTDATTYDTLRHKGKWQQSLHKSVPAARPFVDEASRSTVNLDETLGWNEDAFKGMVKLLVKKVDNLSGLVRLYRAYQPPITTLNTQLSRTDALIDQLVYRLYALTPAEIALVEAS